MEAKRQERKLNFILSQTELYSHFMAKKQAPVIVNVEPGDEPNDGLSRSDALEIIKVAVDIQVKKIQNFDESVKKIKGESLDFAEPNCFKGKLKKYQIFGLNWLISLYEQGKYTSKLTSTGKYTSKLTFKVNLLPN